MSHQYYIEAASQKVFDALTTPEVLVKWLANHAELTPRTGGRYVLRWTDGPTHTGEILEFESGKSIALAWEWPGVSLKGTVLRFSITPKGPGALLTIGHSGFPKAEEWTELYVGAEWGWTYFAMNLKSVLETGRDLRSEFDG